MFRKENQMSGHLTAFFIIALLAELGTTWVQKLRTVTDVNPGLYYPNFRTLLLERLLVWLILFVSLSVGWILVVKRWSRN